MFQNQSNSKCFALESLFHPTAKRPSARYSVLDRWLGKMPSYLRRAAIEAAYGLVSSYLSNYSNWLDDAARERGSRPPRLGFSNVFPPLYGGNMIKLGADWRSAEIKLLKADGQWAFSPPLRVKGRLKRLATHATLCPSLILRGSKARLSCPSHPQPNGCPLTREKTGIPSAGRSCPVGTAQPSFFGSYFSAVAIHHLH